MKNKKKIEKEAVVLLIIVAMFLSSVTVTANNVDYQTPDMLSKLGTEYTDNQNMNTKELTPQTQGIRDVILFESFEDEWVDDSDGDPAPPGWENHIQNTGSTGTGLPFHWGRVETVSFTSGDVVPPDGDWQAMVMWDYGDQDEWLITPEITLGTNSELTFEFYGHYGSTNPDHYYVKVSPSGGYDKTDFTDEIWDASAEPAQDNHYDFPVVLDLSDYDEMTIRIAWQDYAIGGLWYAHFIDAVEVTSEGGPDPLIADADGPYEAFEGEDIQFQGSASGGVPPYSYEWDFGNGDTSNEEDPIYSYDAPGVYDVVLTVTDSEMEEATDDTTATINELPCCFEVQIPTGFGFGLKADVTEICDESHTNVPWAFQISGGLFVIPLSPLSGTANFAAGETKTFKAPLVFGLGSIQITFTIGENCDPTTVSATILGPFVIVK